MLKPGDQHLTEEEVERLCRIQQTTASTTTEKLGDSATNHLLECQKCRLRLEQALALRQELLSLRATESRFRTESCPPESEWMHLVAGLKTERDSLKMLQHAADCDYCGPLLKGGAAILSEETTAEEKELLSRLASVDEGWQATIADRMVVTSGSPIASRAIEAQPKSEHAWWRATVTLRRLSWTGALAAVVAGAIWIGIRFSATPDVNSLLAKAYAERRTIEVRIPNAKRSPGRFERGRLSSFDAPRSLGRAREQILDELERDPSSLSALHAKVEALMQYREYDEAIKTATILFEKSPESFDALSGLGAAYLARCRNNYEEDNASEHANALDCARAYEYLSQAHNKQPNDLTVLFNSALAAESNHLYDKARDDWRLVVAKENDQGWRDEAQEHLQKVEKKLQGLPDGTRLLPEDIDVFAVKLSGGEENQIASLVESGQRVAIEKWITELAGASPLDERRRESLENVLHLLGENLRLHHQDAWLADLLSRHPERFDKEAILLLSRAMSESERGEERSAASSAMESAEEFGKTRNEPGRLIAEFERVYASRLGADAATCYASGSVLLKELQGRNYAWLEVQTQLEVGACANALSRPEEAILLSEAALSSARSANLPNLELRALVFAADSAPNVEQRMRALSTGLAKFWETPSDRMRGYSFYATLDYETADELQLWHLNAAVIQEGLKILNNDPDLAMRSLEQFRLARALLAIGENDRAKETMAEAHKLQMQSGSPALITGSAIDLAEAFVMKGRESEALALLNSVEPTITEMSQDFVTQKFYATKGAAVLAMGQRQDAERNLLLALSIARKRLRNISTEEHRREWADALRPLYRSFASIYMKSDLDEAFKLWESFKGLSLAINTNSSKDEEDVALNRDLPRFTAWSSEGTVFLSYASLAEGLAVWSYNGSVTHGRLLGVAPRETLELARRFAAECSDAAFNSPALKTDGHELYNALLKPVADWIKGKSNLVIELDGDLELVPFEVLSDDEGNYVGDSINVEYSPGLFYIGKEYSSWRINKKSRLLAVGESEADRLYELPGLPGASEEAREVAAFFSSPVVLLDSKATPSRVTSALSKAEIVHLAGHAITSSRGNGLLLSNGDEGGSRVLTAKDLSPTLDRRNRLVVFSACSTTNGSGLGLSDSQSLVRGALAAGVPVVVGSRWQADSDAARAWMRPFYETLLAGGDPSTAAKAARLAVRNKPEWRHPYFWASFAVFV